MQVGAAQLLWLTEELRQAEEAGQKVVVVCHSPIAAGLTWNHNQLLQCLHNSNVAVYLHMGNVVGERPNSYICHLPM